MGDTNGVVWVDGDLLDATEAYIAQQCNCLGVFPKGLSEAIARRFPYANPYRERLSLGGRNLAIVEHRATPGTISVHESVKATGNPTVVCMFAQWDMGRPGQAWGSARDRQPPAEHGADTHVNRRRWFKQCLDAIAEIKPESVAFPYKIGCGMAGGHWERDYLPMIEAFASETPGCRVVIYKQ
ncbi:macro domain-containing protein [Medusavirus stheno T3]|uniref:Macro domain-containing protein n=1 Tax=Medusavirus stheno T3 TaxID=3069717 RepID=A0A7S8BD21_9VIRU|nr:macro domain-containing protein [Acanthamoeba castellanii medusavirus]QPB44379.1 macro domain-containing protein [Medusavirus stheno T3]